jgi:FAD/FMN-containing dehydrogenase
MMKKTLEDIVGVDHVFDDPEVLKSYSEDRSLSEPRRPSHVVRPERTEEIQAIIKLANETLTPVVPVSSGAHFDGAAIPQEGGIILDLRRLNRVLGIDKRNRAVRIEPGVTWGQLRKELTQHELTPLTPLVPHPLKSALTSTLEREPTLIPKTEYGEPVLTMEVVLPNGEVFRTGSAAVGPPGHIQTDLVGPSGPGLDWFRLFQGAQGTFCVVTWMNMKAPPLPKKEKVFFIPFQRIERAVEPLYAIVRRMLGAECFLLNRFSLASILAKKWPDDFKALRKGLPPFTLVLCLSGGKIFPKEKIEYQEADLREVARQFKMTVDVDLAATVGKKGIAILNLLRSGWEREPYWKERFKERCCDIFFYTTLHRVPYFMRLVNEMASDRGYHTKEIGNYVQPVDGGRACYLEFSFPWNEEERQKICDLYVKVSTRLVNEGAFFGRPYGRWSDLVYNRNSALTATLRKLKGVLDPNEIMNPGRLCF